MKAYAVFAKKTEEFQAKGDYTIWHFLNDTDDIEEAVTWKRVAEDQTDKYRKVIIVIPVITDIKVVV